MTHAYRCWAQIDLGALERNLRNICAALPPHIRYVGVVKADAYGHGIAETATRLMRCGVSALAVANLDEAAAIAELSPNWPVLLLSAVLPQEDGKLLQLPAAIPAVSSPREVERFAAIGLRRGTPLAVHLKIDTGMGRAGVWHEEARALYGQLVATPGLELRGIFTHYASADSDPRFTELQRERFVKVLASLPGLDPTRLLIHADNSAGVCALEHNGIFNAVRVGLLQFGIAPYRDALLASAPVEPVLSFHTRVGLVKNLPAGTGISYGSTHKLCRDTRIAVLTAGYGDGIPVSASGRAQVAIRGRRCPVLGRVTMDQIIVDVTDNPGVTEGDEVLLIGGGPKGIALTEFCEWAGQIPWEVLCSITKRVHRLYVCDTAL